MGFKKRASYVAEGWVLKAEASVGQMRLNSQCPDNPAEEILILDENELEEGVNYRRVRVQVGILVEEVK